MTLVVDASVVAEVLLRTPRGSVVGPMLVDDDLIAPSHLTAEVTSIVRGWSLGHHIGDEEALRALDEFWELGIEQLDLIDAAHETWELRHDLTAYDAFYVVLARATGCDLVTFDARMAAAAPDCTIVPATRG